MSETKLGRVVHGARGYIVVEVLEPGSQGQRVVGFSLFGPHASSSIIYANEMEAREALHDLEGRTSGL